MQLVKEFPNAGDPFVAPNLKFRHRMFHVFSFVTIYIPLTNRVRGPCRKLRTEFFPLRFVAQARSARAINRKGKNEDP